MSKVHAVKVQNLILVFTFFFQVILLIEGGEVYTKGKVFWVEVGEVMVGEEEGTSLSLYTHTWKERKRRMRGGVFFWLKTQYISLFAEKSTLARDSKVKGTCTKTLARIELTMQCLILGSSFHIRLCNPVLR